LGLVVAVGGEEPVFSSRKYMVANAAKLGAFDMLAARLEW
jgi:hypothetical protein